ncbi:alpha/beta hydrolase [Skermanella aerolata]|uniref:Alpha/beta hydrolase n=1 Tax=Skermanella aerolata TaxID=393310 RepID=A0A512DHS1_9PROT|nr:alpha/beta hydrolase [Skermanella aerolata]
MHAGGFHRIAYAEWGPEDADRTVVCVHGLTRNSHDFDELAPTLAAEGFRVVCPDVAGRGRSGRLIAAASYAFPQYLADMTALVARLDVEQVYWVGTSMGGLIGMMLAAQPDTPVARLILNDVGAFMPAAALQAIASYVVEEPEFDDIGALEAGLRARLTGYAPVTAEQWRRLAEHEARVQPNGKLKFGYDPAIGAALAAAPAQDVDLWPIYDRITCPTLLLRGGDSNLLTPDTAHEMTTRGPRAELVEFPGVGHAPPLMAEDQIAAVRDFLVDA